MACSANNACIPSTSCCTGANCPAQSETSCTDCSGAGGVCQICGCNGGYANIDGLYSNGCECRDTFYNTSCGGPAANVTVGISQSFSYTGNLPLSAEQDWFKVSYPSNTSPSYHPKITIAGDTGVVFAVYGSCGGGTIGCNDGGGGAGITTWETQYTANANVNEGGTYITFGSGNTVWVEVYRASGALTCNNYIITFSD